MGTNNFLVECVLRTEPGITSGGIAGKCDDAGYALEVGPGGAPRMRLRFPGGGCARTSSVAIADGRWHHVIAEVDRSAGAVHLYVDGALTDGPWSGELPEDASVANHADFTVGVVPGTDGDPAFLAGQIDFLRVSRGTLADAETTIEQLYAWEFDGPFLRDFEGQAARGAGRDVGAVEWAPGAAGG